MKYTIVGALTSARGRGLCALAGILLALSLAGCGGAEDSQTPDMSLNPVRVIRAAADIYNGVDAVDAAEQALDWAEQNFRQDFPTHQSTQSFECFRYRFYPETGVYVGIAIDVTPACGTTEFGAYTMGGRFGNAPAYQGRASDYVVPIPRVSLWRTGQTESLRAGDDGAVQAGIPWPAPRFTDLANGTVLDNMTGILWAKNANCFGPQSWAAALTLARTLSSGNCGITDGSVAGEWRLPNRKELLSLVDFSRSDFPEGHPFVNTFGLFWSSTTAADKTTAWLVSGGGVGPATKNSSYIPNSQYYVWPIRVSRSAGRVRLAATGQRTCYDENGQSINCQGTGQDGDSMAGVLWNEGRFETGPNCVNDRFTGLTWATDANLLSRAVKWNEAMDFVDSLNSGVGLCGFKDWRLPNAVELESMVNLEFADSSAWLRGQGFRNVQAAGYWSSTGRAGTVAQGLGAGGVAVNMTRDQNDFFVWPVRGRR